MKKIFTIAATAAVLLGCTASSTAAGDMRPVTMVANAGGMPVYRFCDPRTGVYVYVTRAGGMVSVPAPTGFCLGG